MPKGIYKRKKVLTKEDRKKYWKEYSKNYDKKHPRQKKERQNRYTKTTRRRTRRLRRQTDPKYRLDNNMSFLIWYSLKGKKAGQKWEKLTGYTIQNLIKHLEKQFDDKMNWDNYGSYWWIDHIKPRSSFKYKKPEDEEFRKCWALSNLQPLEKIKNIKKGNKFKVDISINNI